MEEEIRWYGRRIKQLGEEYRKLKQLVADLSLHKHMLQDVLKKNGKTSDATTYGPLSYLHHLTMLNGTKMGSSIGR